MNARQPPLAARPLAGLILAALATGAHAADGPGRDRIERVVAEAIRPVMEAHSLPGMAVAVTIDGQRHVFGYGVASRESGRPVTESTLFEIGSVSKTFAATLAAYGAASGALRLSDKASRHMPALSGSRFDEISLLDLGTYTAGGLPLQFPREVKDEATMITYFKAWQPAYAPGTYRLYSNPSLGLFGNLAARGMGGSFDGLMEGRLLPLLGLTGTFLKVPKARMGDYAQGYTGEGRPVRVNPGVFASEAYGIKTSAADLIRFVEANIDPSRLDGTLRRAIDDTHLAYDRVGPMMQGLGWEMLAEPTLRQLVDATSPEFALKPARVERLDPPRQPAGEVWFHKTGATLGFGAYAAYVPARRFGIVMLANKNYPNAARVTAAHDIMTALAGAR
ncbi:class C beta-lactamase [Salinarimonas soli]|uniref:Beta-lactamase n=1 Tax=Salinarimonas soli TaxID=1638099 RepID=A0A5B2V9B6_9HYPH|nr:class C beta-lactamase [Salinarimonas soli]KAA2235426.1 beta-lactamase [Salinarimonas soli]